MALLLGFGGTNFFFNNVIGPGLLLSAGQMVSSSSLPVGRNTTFGFASTGGGGQIISPSLGGPFSGMIAGGAFYLNNVPSGGPLITFMLNGAFQCEVRVNGGLNLIITRNGTVLFTSAFALVEAVWTYIEFKALFSTSSGGTCEVRVNGTVVATVSGVTNATGAANANQIQFGSTGNYQGFFRDLYTLDTSAGINTTYLGDVTLYEAFDVSPGINSKWLPAVNVGPFALTSVANGGGALAIFTGTITGGTSNAFVNYAFNTNSFFNSNNNVKAATCASSNATALVLTVGAAITSETNAASAVATPPFALSNVSTSNVFTGYIPGGASNAYLGYNFTVNGFGNAANNVVNASCTASNATSLTLAATGLVAETHGSPVANATFENVLQIGINTTGTRPNGDAVYLYDSTPGDISDFVHQQLVVTGTILGVFQYDNARKDDAGTRVFQQFVNSGGTVATSSNVSPGNTYQYWIKVWESDPNTNTQWSLASFNSATFGVKEIA